MKASNSYRILQLVVVMTFLVLMFGQRTVLAPIQRSVLALSPQRLPDVRKEDIDCRFSECEGAEQAAVVREEILRHFNTTIFKEGSLDGKFAAEYKTATPFPHIVIDDLVPRHILKTIAPDNGLGEFPETWAESVVEHGYKLSKQWFPNSESLCDKARENGLSHHWRCIASQAWRLDGGGAMLKFTMTEEPHMRPYVQGFMSAMKSDQVLRALEELSGIAPLYADSFNFGSGMHQTLRGGSLEIHSDFRQNPSTKLERRVNLFVYFNDDWEEEWKGHLEFWNKDMTKCGARIAPLFGRMAIFSTSDFSYHGNADPLESPAHRTRRSIAMYYYSPIARPAETIDKRFAETHSTLYQMRSQCDSCSKQTCQPIGGAVTGE